MVKGPAQALGCAVSAVKQVTAAEPPGGTVAPGEATVASGKATVASGEATVASREATVASGEVAVAPGEAMEQRKMNWTVFVLAAIARALWANAAMAVAWIWGSPLPREQCEASFGAILPEERLRPAPAFLPGWE